MKTRRLLMSDHGRRVTLTGGWTIYKSTVRTLTIGASSTMDLGSKFNGRRYRFTWDGQGFKRQGQYLSILLCENCGSPITHVGPAEGFCSNSCYSEGLSHVSPVIEPGEIAASFYGED